MPQTAEHLARISVPELDDILGVPIPVLDDGFVRVIDYMGTDQSIVQAARVSYGEGTKQRHEDRGLIRYLLRHRHSTPFEMCELKLHLRVPMDTWRQWIRHRTANVNEYSTRYSIAIDAAQRTPADGWRLQATSNRQGSAGCVDPDAGAAFSIQEEDLHRQLRSVYDARIQAGIAREQARKDLPLSTYTEAYWKIDLHNLLHFLELRMDAHAQLEVRQYAATIGENIVARWCPITWEAFQEYRMQRLELSATEQAIIAAIARGDAAEAVRIAQDRNLLRFNESGPNRNLEREELEAKLTTLGLSVPWAGR